MDRSINNSLKLVLVGLLFWTSVQAAEPIPAADGPVSVEIDLLLLDLDGIDDVGQSYTANVYLGANWRDPSLAHAGPRSVSYALSEVWNPRLQILNQQRVIKSFPDIVEVSPDGKVTYRQRFWGSFSHPLQLSDFPFDMQALGLQVISAGFKAEEVRIFPSARSGASGRYSIADWNVVGHEVGPQDISFEGIEPPLSAIVLTLYTERYWGYYLVKIVLPMIMIVIMSMLVFWIAIRESATQIGVATTAMLTLIAYRFMVGSTLPKLSFLTRLDYFILASTVLVFSCLLLVVWVGSLSQQGQIEKARAQTISRYARWFMPLMFAILVVETLWLNILKGL